MFVLAGSAGTGLFADDSLPHLPPPAVSAFDFLNFQYTDTTIIEGVVCYWNQTHLARIPEPSTLALLGLGLVVRGTPQAIVRGVNYLTVILWLLRESMVVASVFRSHRSAIILRMYWRNILEVVHEEQFARHAWRDDAHDAIGS